MNNLNAKYATNILQDKTCDSCDFNLFCNKRNKQLYNTCLKWQKSSIGDILKVIRIGYPNLMKNELASVKPMPLDKDIKYIKY